MRHTILVVDDEPDVVKSVQDLLRLDYNVLGTTSTSEAMEILCREMVHVVMTDQRMPEMTGVELLKSIRGEHPEAIRLLFTGYADIHAVIDAINQGNVYRYITKPWEPEELETVIRDACNHYDLLVERKQLMVELHKKNTALADANKALTEANQLKQAFIQVASHELRTPLTILLGLSKLALREPASSDHLQEFLKRIDQAAERLRRLIEQIVTMLSVEKFDLVLEREQVELTQLLQQAADDIRPFAELRHQKLIVNLPEKLGVATLDREKIRESVNHLLLNAIKFTPDAGMITLNARREGQNTIVDVIDTGKGIPCEDLPKLFQPFFTSKDVSKHSSGHYEFGKRGLGLGLTVVKAFVDKHGGTVKVNCGPEGGSTFTLTIPDSPETTA